jgi:four helix bundle protein
MQKTYDKAIQKHKNVLISCEAGVSSLMNDPLVELGFQLMDETAAILFDADRNHPLHYVRDQLLRSTGSITANTAEGIGRATPQEVLFKLRIARGEAYESYVWLRALKKPSLLELCLKLCNELDSRIITITKELLAQLNDEDAKTEALIAAFKDAPPESKLICRRFGESLEAFAIRSAQTTT